MKAHESVKLNSKADRQGKSLSLQETTKPQRWTREEKNTI